MKYNIPIQIRNKSKIHQLVGNLLVSCRFLAYNLFTKCVFIILTDDQFPTIT